MRVEWFKDGNYWRYGIFKQTGKTLNCIAEGKERVVDVRKYGCRSTSEYILMKHGGN